MGDIAALGSGTTTPRSFAQKEASALLAVLQHACNSDFAVDVCLLLSGATLVAVCTYKRPRTTGIVAAVWLAWFICHIALDESAWSQVVDHAAGARYATEVAIRSVATMLVAWLVLGMPIVVDLERILSPAAEGAWVAWGSLSWQERGVAAVCLTGFASAGVAGVAVWRHQDTMRSAAFQLSFFVVGPPVWWLASRLPHGCAIAVACLVVYAVPALASLHALLELQRWRETCKRQTQAEQPVGHPLSQAWLAWGGLQSEDEAPCPDELADSMRLWLSYWSCWPFFHVAYVLLRSTDLVGGGAQPAADGALVVLVLWAQFWRASRVALHLYSMLEACFLALLERARECGTSKLQPTQALHTWSRRIGEMPVNRWVLVGLAAAMVLTAASLALEAIAVAQSFVTLAILVAAAADSARCAVQSHTDAVSSRLAFWVLAMGWLGVRDVPYVGSLLAVWTPVVLVAAFAAGETVVNTTLRAGRAAYARLSGELGPEPEPPAGADGSVLVPQVEEDVPQFSSASATRPTATDQAPAGPPSSSILVPVE
mmetsp:Transcript_57726/g.162802  ORF Transcript_57726/g.162802 Transcript_57726/m.162802 type:complete len:542 (-) Transcript_57726:132-1757(-)